MKHHIHSSVHDYALVGIVLVNRVFPLDLPNNNYEFVEELTLTEASYGLSQA